MAIYCEHCGKNILDQYIVQNAKNYHPLCFQSHIQLKCTFCKKGIEGYYLRDDWGNTCCEHHKLNTCTSCDRIIIQDDVQLADGRIYCKFCFATVINHDVLIQRSYNNVLEPLKNVGIEIFSAIPIELVSKSKLVGLSSTVTVSDIYGLAETQFNNALLGKRTTHSHRIYILENLPEIDFKSILAHELLHTWVNDYGLSLNQAELEGFCNLGSYLVLSKINSKKSEILIEKMKKDTSPIYGDGFRKQLLQLQKKGWKNLIFELKRS